jgi:phosphate acyltransferase
MSKLVRIALDAMGGDHGPEVIVAGAAYALARHSDINFLFFGDENLIAPLIATHNGLAGVSIVRHTDVAVKMGDKPSQALRAGRRRSSMWLAIEAVKKGEADVAISAGNTGALMAMAKICLHMIPSIDRPALAAVWPTIRGRSIVLDAGATIGADAHHLVELALMGSAMARTVFGLERPTVGLLNIGTEEIKGIEEVKSASKILREMNFPHLDYRGFVEGHDIGRGTVDVVVTEGFSGNIAVKTAEGTARQFLHYLREAFNGSFLAKIGYLFARPALTALFKRIDPRKFNGSVFLGPNGVVIKSHGSSDAIGTARAIETGYEMVRDDLLSKINESLTFPALGRVAAEALSEEDAPVANRASPKLVE